MADKEKKAPRAKYPGEQKQLDVSQANREKLKEEALNWLYEHGFPVHDPDMAESLIQFQLYKQSFRNSFGRPTKFTPELTRHIIDMGEKGFSMKQIANVLGVSYQTLWAWGKENHDFSDALMRAREAAQAWWETVGQSGLIGKGFNFPVWNKIISSRFRQDYTDRKGVPYNPAEAETIEAEDEVVQLDPRDMTEEQVEALRIAIASAKKQETE